MERCQRLQILQLGPALDQGPGPNLDLTLGLALEASLDRGPGNAAIGKFRDFSAFDFELHEVPFCM